MSREREFRVLLDTSFILPTLGIEVNERVYRGLMELRRRDVEILVSNFSLLESLWVAVKLMKAGRFDRERFFLGLESIISSGIYSIVAPQKESTYRRALELFMLGHEDMIDNLLYSVAMEKNAFFLTIDDEFRDFISRNRLEDIVVSPEELSKRHSAINS